MKTKLLIAVTLVSIAGFGCQTAPSVTETTSNASRGIAAYNSNDCLKEAERDGCWFSQNDSRDITQYTTQCASFESGSGKTKVIAWRLNDGSISLMKTKGPGANRDSCPVWKVTTGEGGTKDLAVRDNKLFFLTNNGNVYYTFVDIDFYELRQGRDKSYTDINKLDGSGDDMKLIKRDGSKIGVTDKFLENAKAQGHIQAVSADKIVKFVSDPKKGGRSPFHN